MTNVVVKMLGWRTKNLTDEETEALLAAVANVKVNPFMLNEVLRLMPESVLSQQKKRRSVTFLLNVLVDLGYLEKPSERKWFKKAQSLSYYLSPKLFELQEIEKVAVEKAEERKVMKFAEETG